MSQENPSGSTEQSGRSGPIIVITLLLVVLLVSSFVIWRLSQLRARIHAQEGSAPGGMPSQKK